MPITLIFVASTIRMVHTVSIPAPALLNRCPTSGKSHSARAIVVDGSTARDLICLLSVAAGAVPATPLPEDQEELPARLIRSNSLDNRDRFPKIDIIVGHCNGAVSECRCAPLWPPLSPAADPESPSLAFFYLEEPGLARLSPRFIPKPATLIIPL